MCVALDSVFRAACVGCAPLRSMSSSHNLTWSDRHDPPPPHTLCSLWFTPQLEAEEGMQLERSAAERAQQLADVALAVYEAGGEQHNADVTAVLC